MAGYGEQRQDFERKILKENEELRNALKEIQMITMNNHDHDAIRVFNITCEQLKEQENES